MKKLIVNDTNSPMYSGSQMIPPGEQVMVDVPDEPTEPAPAAEPTLAEMVAGYLKKSVADLVKDLPDASHDALTMMQAVEAQAEKPRKSLLTAIADELIKRADAALKSDQP